MDIQKVNERMAERMRELVVQDERLERDARMIAEQRSSLGQEMAGRTGPLPEPGQDALPEQPQTAFRVQPERCAELDPGCTGVKDVSNLPGDLLRSANQAGRVAACTCSKRRAGP